MNQPKVVFDPPQAGKLVWRSPTELVFTPDRGALLAGHHVGVKIPELAWESTVHVPYFAAAGKVASWPVEPGQPRFVALLNGFVSHLGRGPLFVLYDQPVDPAVIGRGLEVKVGAKKVAARVVRPASGEQVYDTAIPLDHIVTLELERMPPDGETVSIAFPSRDDAGPAPLVKELSVNTSLTTPGFVDNAAAGRTRSGRAPRTPLDASFSVALSNQITAKQFAAHVRLDPPPRSMRTYVNDSTGGIHALLAPGVLYTLTLDAGLNDVLGNKLRAPVTATFRAQDAAPTLALPDDLVLEHGHMKLPIKVSNLGAATLVAQKFASAQAWIAARSAGHPCTGDERALDLDAPLNETATREAALDPGLYCLQVAAKGRGSEAGTDPLHDRVYVQVSSAGVTAKVADGAVFLWATKLSDASPLAGARVAITDATGKTLASGTAAADGTAKLAGAALADASFVAINDGELVMPLADARLSRARQFNLDPQIDRATGAEPLAASLFTERGVYRPGETVSFRALVRDPDTMRAATGKLDVQVLDPRGEKLGAAEVALDAFGGASHEVALASAARVGEYTIRATLGGRTSVRTFRVEEYRVPTFQVAVDTDEAWSARTPARATVSATYLHGGALAGRELRWELSRTAEPFAPAGFKGFLFDASTVRASSPESLTRGTARLDGQGRFVVPVVPDHASKAGPMRYVVEASVADVDRQAYAGRATRVVHPGDVYVGIAPPPRNLFAAGDTLTVPVVAVAPDGAARPGVDVAVVLERIDHHGATRLAGHETQRIHTPIATVVKTCTVATKARAVECKLAIPEAGEYVVRATATDAKRRPVEAAFRIAASGPNAVAWPRFDNERISVVADKASYQVGDVARLMIQSPFPKAKGLLAIERGGVVEHRLFEIDNDTPEVKVPITAAHVPNIYASVVILRGRIHDAVDATGFQTGAPAFRMGYAELRVEPRAHKLDVEVTPATAKAAPGSTVAVDLAVRDAAGAPRAGQATVMVVDEAVLGLTRFRTPDPIGEMFAPRPLAVRTGESRL
ncbi:MAG: hypothetical protein KIT31_36060, partial [Deltaproteobacteria bacterium]|nr:hypothetical protein [Deltaproteobacteria bacterium]